MKKSQKKQSNTKKASIVDIILLLFVFASPVINSLLFIIRRQSESGQLAFVYIIVAIATMFGLLIHHSRVLPRKTGLAILLLSIIAIGFISTILTYGTDNSWFMSEFKAYFAMALNVILLTLLIIWSKKTEINLSLILIFNIALTLISALVLMKKDSVTTGGLLLDSSGFIYQNLAYYSAYCIGLTMFILGEKKKTNKLNNRQIPLYLLLLLIQLFICFASGGRGGAVLSIVLIIYELISIFGIRKSYKIIIPCAIIGAMILFIFPKIIGHLGIDFKGFDRALTIFDNRTKDTGRAKLFSGAIKAFNNKPITGNGIGSIFYLIDSYSHNIFTDILAEIGIVGIIVTIIILIIFVKNMNKLYSESSMNRFMALIFVCGFTMNLFSGYIWVNQMIWLPITYTICNTKKQKDTIKYEHRLIL